MKKKIGLRERKFAKTRLKLAEALVQRLQESTLEEIVVRDLCEDAEISEATFFNYFPRKVDLLDYYTHLWMLDLNWRCQNSQRSGLEAIAVSFDFMGQAFQNQTGVMSEIIGRQALQREKPKPVDIGLAERIIAYPEHTGVEDIPIGGVDKAWLPALEQAIRSGELPPNSHMPTLMVGLASIFYGVPLVVRQSNVAAIPNMYAQQLAVFWAGIKTVSQGIK
ncbi:TetR/AcrR family transcriptional regulator [Pseudomonadota bacterium]